MTGRETHDAEDPDDSFAEGRVVAMQLAIAIPIVFLVFDMDVVAPGFDSSGGGLDAILYVIGPPALLLFVFMLGFPIRLDPAPRTFWTGTGRISLFGSLAGAFVLALAWVFGRTIAYDLNGRLHHDFIPNEVLTGIGMIALAFFLMNARFPFMESAYEVERPRPTPP